MPDRSDPLPESGSVVLGIARTSEDYWDAARRPFASLVFLAPFVVLYEIGVWWIASEAGASVRNGVDVWLRRSLSGGGTTLVWLPPVMVLGGLLVWHVADRDRWNVRPSTLAGMLAESVLFAFLLMLGGRLQTSLLSALDVPCLLSVPASLSRTVTYVGAGIYEELVFRLCLLPGCYGLFRAGGVSVRWSVTLAVLATSAAFSIAHYVSGVEAFALRTFAFRLFAGVYFAVLFVKRGFGVTVGCHAAYDVLVGVLFVV